MRLVYLENTEKVFFRRDIVLFMSHESFSYNIEYPYSFTRILTVLKFLEKCADICIVIMHLQIDLRKCPDNFKGMFQFYTFFKKLPGIHTSFELSVKHISGFIQIVCFKRTVLFSVGKMLIKIEQILPHSVLFID